MMIRWERINTFLEEKDFDEKQSRLTSRTMDLMRDDTELFFNRVLETANVDNNWLIEHKKRVRYISNAIVGQYRDSVEEIVNTFLHDKTQTNDERLDDADKSLNRVGGYITKKFGAVITKENRGQFLIRLMGVSRVTWERADEIYLALPNTTPIDIERLSLYVYHELIMKRAENQNQLWLFESEIQAELERVFMIDYIRNGYDESDATKAMKVAYSKSNKMIMEVAVPEATYQGERAFASKELYEQLELFFQRVVDIQRVGAETQDDQISELDYVNRSIKETEEGLNFILSPEQYQAVHAFWQNSIFILSGEAGSGKTTTVRAIINSIRQKNKDTVVFGASLTGRASHNLSRIAKLNDGEWGTLHRLKAINDFGGTQAPKYKDIDVLIVEEFSMVELNLFVSIISKLRNDVKVLFVGDMEQLPPIDVGFSYDFTKSSISEWLHLKEIQRQDKSGVLYQFINNVREEKIDTDLLSEGANADYSSDFRFITAQGHGETITHSIREYMRFIRTGAKEFNNREAQYGLRVLASTNRVVDSVNEGIQEKLLEWSNLLDIKQGYTEFNKQQFYIGDRIAINSNISGTIISNGMTGTIVGFEMKENYGSSFFDMADDNDKTGKLIHLNSIENIIVKFDDLVEESTLTESQLANLTEEERKEYTEKKQGIRRLSTYDYRTLGNFKLGYATTIHKAQGLTLNKVIVGFVYSNYMNSKQLLYTSISRPDEQLVLISSTYVLREAIDKDEYVDARALYKAIIPNLK